MRSYVKDLKQLLEKSQLVEEKAFLKSFVERIEVGDTDAKVTYAIPMPPNNLETETIGVLPFIENGSAYGICYRVSQRVILASKQCLRVSRLKYVLRVEYQRVTLRFVPSISKLLAKL